MTRTAVVLLLLLTACATVPARVDFEADPELIEAERQLTRAIVRHDRAVLNQLVAEDFDCTVRGERGFDLPNDRVVLTTCTGFGPRPTTTRADAIEDLERKQRPSRSAEILTMNVTRDGDRATVVSTQAYRRWQPYDAGYVRHAKVTDTWVRGADGTWRLRHRDTEPMVDFEAANEDPEEAELIEAERRLTRAIVRNDGLRRLLAPDFGCTVAGVPEPRRHGWILCTAAATPPSFTRAEAIQKLEERRPRSAEILEIEVKREGDHATVVSTQLYRHWHKWDAGFEQRAVVTDTFIRGADGRWRLRWRESAPITAVAAR